MISCVNNNRSPTVTPYKAGGHHSISLLKLDCDWKSITGKRFGRYKGRKEEISSIPGGMAEINDISYGAKFEERCPPRTTPKGVRREKLCLEKKVRRWSGIDDGIQSVVLDS